MEHSDIVIVGAGEAGVRAAFALREGGFDGSVILLSEEGALPYERPPLSKSSADSRTRHIASETAYEEAGIVLRRDMRVLSIDPDRKVIALKDGTLGYGKLLLTTGAEARRLPQLPQARYLRRDTDAADILPRLRDGTRLVIVGAGLIGLELAATARSRGAKVTVIEIGPRILGRAVPEELANSLHRRHEQEGVHILTGMSVTPTTEGLRLADGTLIEADLVVAGIGSVPRTDLAEAAGLTCENGIVVDSHFRTSVTDIYAAGDCCAIRDNGTVRRYESWRVAREQAEQAALAMSGKTPVAPPRPYFWSDQYDLCLQVSGLHDPCHRSVARKLEGKGQLIFQLDETGRISAVGGLGQGTGISKDFKLSERLLQAGACPNPTQLADPTVSLKKI